jgi:hypothetical protein
MRDRLMDGSCRKSGDAKGLPLAARQRSGHTGGGAEWSGPAGIRPIGNGAGVGVSWKSGRYARKLSWLPQTLFVCLGQYQLVFQSWRQGMVTLPG